MTQQRSGKRFAIDESTPVAKRASMYFSFGRDARPGVKARLTFDAILDGERTSTTRFEIWPGSDSWGRLKPGDLVRFYEDKEMRGRSVVVRVDGVARVHLGDASPAALEEWSKAEGWSAEHGRAIARHGPGWQVRFTPAAGQAILEGRGAMLAVNARDGLPSAERGPAPAKAAPTASDVARKAGLAAALRRGMDW